MRRRYEPAKDKRHLAGILGSVYGYGKVMRTHLVLDVAHGRYKCIGQDLVIFYQYVEPPESWFDATTVSVAKGNDISLTEAFRTAHP